MGAREYDPSLGRFTGMDPLKGSPTDPQQRNRYAYATNNPLTRYDLNGLSVCGPGLRDNIKDAASWTGDAAGEWWNGVQIGWENPSMLWDATGQFANDFFIEDFKVLFSADSSLNERFGAMGFIALNFVPGGKLGKLGKLAKIAKIERTQGKLAMVYRAMDEAGKVKYIGITNNMERRSAEQARRGLGIERIYGLVDLPRSEARAAEQVLIEHHGLQKNGGTLLNRINSISQNNPIYEESIIRGRDLLQSASYTGF